jgi:HlyD family secretion protein
VKIDRSELLKTLSMDRPAFEPARGERTRPRVVFALYIALATLAGALASYFALVSGFLAPGREARAAVGGAPQQQSITPKGDSDIAQSVLTASGYVVARRQATVSAEITGSVVAVLVEEGTHVRKGQLVARLDSRLAELDLEVLQTAKLSAEASGRGAAARAADAQRILDRLRALQAKGFVGEAQVATAESEAIAARETANQAAVQTDTVRAQLQRQRALLAKYEVTTPFSGVVTSISAQVGEIVAPGSAAGGFTRTGICTIVDMDSLELEVEVNEAYISRVAPGQRVNAALDAYKEWRIPASVIAVVPSANRSRGTVKVRIALLSKDPRILPDMAAKVTFLEADTRAKS